MVVYTGVSGAVRTVGTIRTGVGGVVRTVGNGHIGVAGVNRPFMQFKLTDVSYFYFEHHYIYVYGVTYDSNTNVYTSHWLGQALPTSSGYLLSDVQSAIAKDTNGYIKTPDYWAVGLGNTTSNEWTIKGSSYGTTSMTSGNVGLNFTGAYTPALRICGWLKVVLKDGTKMRSTEFFNNSNVASAEVKISVHHGGAGTYSAVVWKEPIFGHVYFPNGVPWNGSREDYTFSLSELKADSYWGLFACGIGGYVSGGILANSAFGDTYIWKFTDTNGNTVTFDKSKVKFTVWT